MRCVASSYRLLTAARVRTVARVSSRHCVKTARPRPASARRAAATCRSLHDVYCAHAPHATKTRSVRNASKWTRAMSVLCRRCRHCRAASRQRSSTSSSRREQKWKSADAAFDDASVRRRDSVAHAQNLARIAPWSQKRAAARSSRVMRMLNAYVRKAHTASAWPEWRIARPVKTDAVEALRAPRPPSYAADTTGEKKRRAASLSRRRAASPPALSREATASRARRSAAWSAAHAPTPLQCRRPSAQSRSAARARATTRGGAVDPRAEEVRGDALRCARCAVVPAAQQASRQRVTRTHAKKVAPSMRARMAAMRPRTRWRLWTR